jgi:Holliday junction resolvase RusA-like endonuclease
VIVEYRTKKLKVKKDTYKTTPPDIDSNVNKGLFDALTGVVWIDDKIVSKITAVKLWSMEDRIDVIIKTLGEY